jgi:hypothetical protein
MNFGSKQSPCSHMKTLLSALADDSLTGLARWYAENHARSCPGCSSALGNLKVLRERVRALGVPSPESLRLPAERWDAIEAAWDELESSGT